MPPAFVAANSRLHIENPQHCRIRRWKFKYMLCRLNLVAGIRENRKLKCPVRLGRYAGPLHFSCHFTLFFFGFPSVTSIKSALSFCNIFLKNKIQPKIIQNIILRANGKPSIIRYRNVVCCIWNMLSPFHNLSTIIFSNTIFFNQGGT